VGFYGPIRRWFDTLVGARVGRSLALGMLRVGGDDDAGQVQIGQ